MVERRISAAHPTSRIIMLTAHGDRVRIRDALRAGASGYLLKDTRADDVVQAVREVYAGITVRCAAGQAGPEDVNS